MNHALWKGSLILVLLVTTQEAFVANIDQDQTAQTEFAVWSLIYTFHILQLR